LYFERSARPSNDLNDSFPHKLARWTLRHLQLAGFSLLLSIIVGIPLGIVASRGGAVGHVILGFASVVQTIPSLALLALLVPLPFFGISLRTAIAALFLYGLCNGRIRKDTPIIEASSGSTAISEAYFARLLGLRFVAVVPEATSKQKLAQIEFFGGECIRVPAQRIYDEAEALAGRLRGHNMDQFANAAHATDWRGNNNIAESIFEQMASERHPVPRWIVVSAGTGGTSATIGRFIRYRPAYVMQTRLCVVDPENSVFFDFFHTGNRGLTNTHSSRIEGIGRPRVEPSFLPEVIDRMIQVPDAASVGTIWWLETVLGRKCGGSTGTNLFGAIHLMTEMRSRGEQGSIVTLICDPGERYLGTYYDRQWVSDQGMNAASYQERLLEMATQGHSTARA
jgi:cysteine synthase A